jgi:predicted phage terminase large subunit-like protein
MHNHDTEVSAEKIDEIVKNQRVRRATTRACHHWFFHIYFSHYVKYKTAQFHKELFELTEATHKTMVIEAFRGSGKTTIMGTSYAIWSILGMQQRKFVLIIAKTESQARQYLANIKLELEHNRLLRLDLGPFEEPNDEWRAVSIVLPKYGARVTVASIDNSIRGIKHGAHRPDLIIADDLEDLDIVKTQESRDKMFNWLMGDIIPLGDKDTRLIVIGTKLHNDSIIMRLKKAILEGRMDGVAKAYPFLDENNQPLWKDKYRTDAEVETLRKSVPSLQAWQREYMLQIIADDDQVIRPEWIRYYDSLPTDACRFTATGIDPAISEKDNADYTAMVSGKIYGRKKALKIYVLPNPVNERMDFPKTIEKIKSLSKTLGNAHVWIENVGYQKSIIDHLKSENFPAKEYKTQGSDKRARLSLVSHHIQSGTVLFPRYGAEKLIEQLVGFGTEKHDDLSDAFCILVWSVMDQESNIPKGYHALFDEKMLNESYQERVSYFGDKRLGVVLADKNRTHSTIALRAENAAEVLYHEPIQDATTVALKVIELAKIHDVPVSDENIFVDKADRGQELCSLLRQLAVGQFNFSKYGNRQRYGITMSEQPQFDSNLFADTWARAYSKLAGWMRIGKLIGRHVFDDLLYVVYTDTNGKRKMIDRETLMEEGIDSSIPDALALTIAKDKRIIQRPTQQEDFEEDDLPQFPYIGI